MGFFILLDIYTDMGKFIISEEDRKSIRGLYGLNEQTNSLSVSGSYTATNCDELHAFQGTGGKVIGDMNVIVKNKIEEWNSNGLNVKPTNVSVSVNGVNVSWTVTFMTSDINWVGFTSRGAGCNQSIDTRAGNDSINNGPKSVVEALKKQGKTVNKIEVINDYKYDGGNNSFKQVFYCYTLITETAKSTPKPKTQPTTKEFVITKKYLNNTKSDDTKLDSLYPAFIKQVRDYIINNGNKNYSIESFDLSSKDRKNVTAKLRIVPDEKGFNKFSLLFNPVGQRAKSLELALRENDGSIEQLKNGTIAKDNEIDPEYEWWLVGLHV
jgi:hypothetical protein